MNKYIQESLNILDDACLQVDGFAGKKTRDAIREFQTKNGLVSDGIAGMKTLSKIRVLLEKLRIKVGNLSLSEVRLFDWDIDKRQAAVSIPCSNQIGNDDFGGKFPDSWQCVPKP